MNRAVVLAFGGFLAIACSSENPTISDTGEFDASDGNASNPVQRDSGLRGASETDGEAAIKRDATSPSERPDASSSGKAQVEEAAAVEDAASPEHQPLDAGVFNNIDDASVNVAPELQDVGTPSTCNAECPLSTEPRKDWAKQLGTEFGDSGRAVAVDASGNVFIAGSTAGDLGAANAGFSDAFVAKWSADGMELWKAQLGTPEDDTAMGVAVDASGNVFIAGYTLGELEGESAGERDAFVAKYSASGALLWNAQLGSSATDHVSGVAVDVDGNAIITGYTYGDLDGVNAGGNDAFVAKYSTDGALLWKTQLGSSDYDTPNGLAVDSGSNVFIAGYTTGDFDGVNAGNGDAFIAKYSAEGTLQWKVQFGTSETDGASGVATDASGNLFIAGYTSGDLAAPSAGSYDVFVAKYSGDGVPLWDAQLGTPSNDSSNGVAVDNSGNVFIVGDTIGDLDGANAGDLDAFIAAYDAEGAPLWRVQFGTPYLDSAESIAVDGKSNVFVGGYTEGDLDGASAGGFDAFVVRYR